MKKVILLLFYIFSASVFAVDLDHEVIEQLNTTNEVIEGVGEIEHIGCFKDIDRSSEMGSVKDINGSDIDISIISEEYAVELFNLLASQKHIPFEYPEDGCYSRAHEMSRILKEMGVTTTKTFLEGRLRVETDNSPKGYVEWWYHVAPMVAVETGKRHKERYSVPGSRIKRTRWVDEYKVMVFDPSIFNRPVEINEWQNIQLGHDGGSKQNSYRTREYNYVPSSKSRNMREYNERDIRNMEDTMERYLIVQEERKRYKNQSGEVNEIIN